ncbi:phytanoyl-CoA dioxygenase family protein [Sphingomonas sp. MMS24-JH45]
MPPDRAGIRLHGQPALAALLAHGPIASIASSCFGSPAWPVRAVLFDKSPDNNWALGWHQDRTVAVRERRAVAGYGTWSVKQGIQHVEPPFAVIENMATLRLHLNSVPENNAPLLVAPGSHRLGRIPEAGIAAAVARCGTATCLAAAGDVWAYATAILHASAASTACGARRRVSAGRFRLRAVAGRAGMAGGAMTSLA